MFETNAFGTRTSYSKEFKGLGKAHTLLLPAGEFCELLPALLDLVSGPAQPLVDVLLSAFKAQDVMGAQIAGASVREGLSHLAAQLARHGELAQRLLKYTTCAQGSLADHFDAAFQGRYGLLVNVLSWVIEVNFGPLPEGDPTGLWGRLMSLGRQSPRESQTSPRTSTSPQDSGSGCDS